MKWYHDAVVWVQSYNSHGQEMDDIWVCDWPVSANSISHIDISNLVQPSFEHNIDMLFPYIRPSNYYDVIVLLNQKDKNQPLY